MSIKYAFFTKKCTFCCTFFSFRAQSYKKISIFAREISLNLSEK